MLLGWLNRLWGPKRPATKPKPRPHLRQKNTEEMETWEITTIIISMYIEVWGALRTGLLKYTLYIFQEPQACFLGQSHITASQKSVIMIGILSEHLLKAL